MDTTTESALYSRHIEELKRRYDEALERAGLKAVLLAAGTPAAIFEDDQQQPFKANPHLLQWAPLHEHPDAILSYVRGGQPELLIFAPDDYWHLAAPVPELLSNGPMNVRIVSSGRELLQHVKTLPSRSAFVGEVRQREDSFGLRRVNPPKLIRQLHYQRSFKTSWELNNIQAANRIAAAGHRAAEDCFRGGGSEYEIHLAFRSACQVTDNELPYPAIVAVNEHAATLHYQRLDKQRTTNRSLLIDAGVNVNGYASDITRSHAIDSGSDFAALVNSMHTLQQELCSAAVPGVDFRELHLAAHQHIGTLLHTAELSFIDAEAAVAGGLTRAFFPHGLGHFLGLQVHDVGALLASGRGECVPQPDSDPYLRLTRILEAGNVITIEPGLYFISALLTPLRSGPNTAQLNWPRIDELSRYGGIRIEDNLHITTTGNENLSRAAFAALPAALPAFL